MTEIAEVKSLREAAVVAGTGHDVLRATGQDRVSFLQRITSGKIAGIEAGQGGRTLLLDVRGHVLASLLVFVRGDSVRVIAARGQGVEVADGLSKFAIMDDFQITLDADLATLAVLGPLAGHALTGVGVAVPHGFVKGPLYSHIELASDAFGALWIAHGRACGTDGLCVVATQPARAALVEALAAAGTPTLAAESAEGLRIAALEPAPGKEITPDRFPVEVGLGAAIDNGKGCYVGQETIVRMRDRGVVRKRLVLVRIVGGEMPSAHDTIGVPGQQAQPAVGIVTSAGQVPGEGTVALAVVANTIPVGAAVEIQHAGAALPATIAAESPPWG
jgi:hypothetical protein